MSYGIIRVQKFKVAAVTGIQIHDKREKETSNTNPDIDYSKSNQNYSLIEADERPFQTQIKEKIDVDFVNFNYSNLAYFDGESNYVPQQLLDESWEDGTLWHDYRIEEEESYIVCYIDNDGKNVWEEYYDYDEAIDRIDELYTELNEENAEKIMLFNKNTEM